MLRGQECGLVVLELLQEGYEETSRGHCRLEATQGYHHENVSL